MKRERLVTWDDPQISAEKYRQLGGLDFLNGIIRGEIPPPPLARVLGMRLIHAVEGSATFEIILDESHYNPLGVVHGGVVSTLLDSAMGCAVQSMLPQGTGYTTTQLNINLVRALTAKVGRVTCTANIIHTGRQLATSEGTVVDEQGKLYAHGTTSCLVFSP